MDWSSEFDTAFLGEDASGAMAAAEVAEMLGWPERHVLRYRTSAGDAAWLRLTKSGKLTCCAIAPWTSLHDADWVHEGALFGGEPWPREWRTKRRVGVDDRVLPPRNDWSLFQVGGFACGMLAKKHAMLCKVVDVAPDGTLRRVQTSPDGPELDVAEMQATRWFGLTKWPEGCATLWESGTWQFHNYPLLTIRAGVAQAKAEGRTISRGKRADAPQPSKRQAPITKP